MSAKSAALCISVYEVESFQGIWIYSVPHLEVTRHSGPCSPSVHHTLECSKGRLDVTIWRIKMTRSIFREEPSEVDVVVCCEHQPNCVNSEERQWQRQRVALWVLHRESKDWDVEVDRNGSLRHTSGAQLTRIEGWYLPRVDYIWVRETWSQSFNWQWT